MSGNFTMPGRVARLGEKAPIWLFLAAFGSIKFGFGTLLLFGLLFESLATTLGDLRRVFAGYIFKPPPPVGAGGGYMFSGRPSVPLSVRASVRDSRGSFMFPRYLQYLLTDFRQTFVTGASWDRDELIRFWGQKVKSSRSRHDRMHPRFSRFHYISSIY